MKTLFLAPLVLLAAPALAEDAPALCTDRPTKATAVCTVPAGLWQLETDLPNWTRTDAGGARSDVVIPANPTLKYGLGANTDIQVNWAPYIHARTRAGGVTANDSGVGDVHVRLKQRLTDSSASFQFGLVPYVKAPTATTGIGNGKWEGGLVAPMSYSLPQGTTLTFSPEIDAIADSDGSGRHAQFVGAINLAKTLSSSVTAYAELWTAQNDDSGGSLRQYSADVALAWLAASTLQFDAGVNFGLNRDTPDAQVYLGVSTRF